MSGQPVSDGGSEEPRRIALPQNIAHTLRYVDDIDLETLCRAVEHEMNRRRCEKGEPADAPARDPPVIGSRAEAGEKKGRATLPLGKASLIRASAQSGMKAQAIARTLRVSLAQVNEVLGAKVERKR